jgi:Lar family restriction alleviation protein
MNKLTRCDNCRFYNATKGNEYTFCGHEKHSGDVVAAFTSCPEHEFMEELQPCPFCGANAVLLTDVSDNVEVYKVVCPHCGISQKSYTKSKYTAVTMWNRRAYR